MGLLLIVVVLSECAGRDGYTIRTRILPARGFDVEANVLDSSRLRKDSGWAPRITLKEGIQRMWNAAMGRKVV